MASEMGTAIPAARDLLVSRVKLLSWLTLVWMGVEGVVGLVAGIAANSIALIGYGLDSSIGAVGSLVVIWRFTGTRLESDAAERRAQKIVAVTFFLMAPYVAAEAVRRLLAGTEAEGSWVGIALATGSVLLMPYLGRAKQQLGDQLSSSATAGEGIQNILCGYLSLAILVGLGANAMFGLWWADPLVALGVAAAAVNAGLRTWRGEACVAAATERVGAQSWMRAISSSRFRILTSIPPKRTS
ncbi:MAG TPA: cation transporter [Gaiellaceae bacterium]|nr:cation transporter [Gaiellaceae bacterium]